MLKNLHKFSLFLVLSSLSVIAAAVTALADNPVPAGSVTSAGGASPAQPGFGSMMVPFALMFGVIYFLMIRPQQKKMKEQQQMMSELKQGDEILTSSGILGKVTGLTEKVVTVEVADNVRVKMLKSQVSQVIKGQIKDLTLG
jgi:preprotein translocase subunit YajC